MRLASKALSEAGAVPFSQLATNLFGNTPQAEAALAALIGIGIRARLQPGEFSLLPARYHFFASGIDNITLRLVADERGRFCGGAAGQPVQ